MPIPSFLQRIRTYVDQLPGSAQPPAPGLQQPSQGFMDRVKQTTQEVLEYGLAETLLPEGPTQSLADVKVRIQKSARNRTKMRMLYVGSRSLPVWRSVECYSFRYRDKDYPHIPQLYAFQDGDSHIKAFKLYKIQDARTTPYPFAPKWTIELA